MQMDTGDSQAVKNGFFNQALRSRAALSQEANARGGQQSDRLI
jgi:hypothetical protein